MKYIINFGRLVIYWLFLRPLIKRNYKLREQGLLPDEWYWADEMACNWGYFVGIRERLK